MDHKTTSIELLIEKFETYAKTTIELTKLTTIAKSADVLSSFLSRIVVSIAVVAFVLFFSFGASFMIGEQLGNVYWGFFIVALFYLLLSLFLYLYRTPWIKTPISDKIITKILKK